MKTKPRPKRNTLAALKAELDALRRELKWQRDFEQAMAQQQQQRQEIVRS